MRRFKIQHPDTFMKIFSKTMEHSQNLPNIERATKDLEKYECSYQVSTEKLRKISNEVENLKVQKQVLKADIVEQNRILQYYSNLHVETASKIENALIRRNKAKHVESSNLEKMKQTKAIAGGNKIIWNAYDFEISPPIGSGTSKDLSLQKEKLEQTIEDNNKFMEELLNKFK